jgi:hypothetical protein
LLCGSSKKLVASSKFSHIFPFPHSSEPPWACGAALGTSILTKSTFFVLISTKQGFQDSW